VLAEGAESGHEGRTEGDECEDITPEGSGIETGVAEDRGLILPREMPRSGMMIE
jgi:hypothetical protein